MSKPEATINMTLTFNPPTKTFIKVKINKSTIDPKTKKKQRQAGYELTEAELLATRSKTVLVQLPDGRIIVRHKKKHLEN